MSARRQLSELHRRLRRAETRSSLAGVLVGLHLGPLVSPGVSWAWRVYAGGSLVLSCGLLWWVLSQQRRAHDAYRSLVSTLLERFRRQ
jgi:hypothetical protein